MGYLPPYDLDGALVGTSMDWVPDMYAAIAILEVSLNWMLKDLVGIESGVEFGLELLHPLDVKHLAERFVIAIPDDYVQIGIVGMVKVIDLAALEDIEFLAEFRGIYRLGEQDLWHILLIAVLPIGFVVRLILVLGNQGLLVMGLYYVSQGLDGLGGGSQLPVHEGKQFLV